MLQPSESSFISDIDDDIHLPADTLAILNEFLYEKQQSEAQKSHSDEVEEDWQLSQFWYDEATKKTLAKVCLKLILSFAQKKPTAEVRVALLSCPSLYKSIKNIHRNGTVRLFEFDNRFSKFGNDYVHYDYKVIASDKNYLEEFRNHFDIVIADPPFLSEECIQSTAEIVNKLKSNDAKVILCSGHVVGEFVNRFLNLERCQYQPQHERNLANEFSAYANFDLDQLI